MDYYIIMLYDYVITSSSPPFLLSSSFLKLAFQRLSKFQLVFLKIQHFKKCSRPSAVLGKFLTTCSHCMPRSSGKKIALKVKVALSSRKMTILSQNVFQKSIEKNLPKIDLGLHFGFPKPPKIAPRSKKIASIIEPKKRLQGRKSR